VRGAPSGYPITFYVNAEQQWSDEFQEFMWFMAITAHFRMRTRLISRRMVTAYEANSSDEFDRIAVEMLREAFS
jgi:hypothetical protein